MIHKRNSVITHIPYTVTDGPIHMINSEIMISQDIMMRIIVLQMSVCHQILITQNMMLIIILLSQNWLKPPSSDGKEKNPYQFL